MYKEFNEAINLSISQTLALDWDETTTDYPLAFKELAKRYDRVIIVTVNDELELEKVCSLLGRKPEEVLIFCCPDDAIENVPEWKSEVCRQEEVALMFDDNPDVVRACHEKGVNAICVSERTWKFEQNS